MKCIYFSSKEVNMLFCAEQSWDTMDWKAKLNELEVKIWERNPLQAVVDIQDSF